MELFEALPDTHLSPELEQVPAAAHQDEDPQQAADDDAGHAEHTQRARAQTLHTQGQQWLLLYVD